MDLSNALDLGRDTLMLALIVAAPILAIGLVIGVIISILQAVTQLQEQTIVFIPKMVAMIIAVVVLLPWIAVRLLDYSRDMLGKSPWE